MFLRKGGSTKLVSCRAFSLCIFHEEVTKRAKFSKMGGDGGVEGPQLAVTNKDDQLNIAFDGLESQSFYNTFNDHRRVFLSF